MGCHLWLGKSHLSAKKSVKANMKAQNHPNDGQYTSRRSIFFTSGWGRADRTNIFLVFCVCFLMIHVCPKPLSGLSQHLLQDCPWCCEWRQVYCPMNQHLGLSSVPWVETTNKLPYVQVFLVAFTSYKTKGGLWKLSANILARLGGPRRKHSPTNI